MTFEPYDPVPCPHCATRKTQRIVYGLLTPEGAREVSKRPDLIAFGCVVFPYTHHCPSCRTHWNPETGEQRRPPPPLMVRFRSWVGRLIGYRGRGVPPNSHGPAERER
jgi:hypothetical protein